MDALTLAVLAQHHPTTGIVRKHNPYGVVYDCVKCLFDWTEMFPGMRERNSMVELSTLAECPHVCETCRTTTTVYREVPSAD